MTISYLIAVLLIVTALIPGIKTRYRLTLLELLICVLLLVAPLSLTRDVPQYQEIFKNFLGIPSFPEVLVRVMLATCFIGILEVMTRSGFSMGSIITFVFLAIPTVAANQLRLSFAILVMLYLSNRLRGISNVLVGSLIHQSLVLNLLLPQVNESCRYYGRRLVILLVFCSVAIINLPSTIETLLPFLGNVETYLTAKEISDIYDQKNYFDGIEFVFYFLFVSILVRSVWPAVAVGAAFVTAKALTDIPTVITMRLFELFCLLFLLSSFRALNIRLIPVLMFGIILFARFYLHYSTMPMSN